MLVVNFDKNRSEYRRKKIPKSESFLIPPMSKSAVRTYLHNHYGLSKYMNDFVRKYCNGCCEYDDKIIRYPHELDAAYTKYLRDVGVLSSLGIVFPDEG